MRRHNRSIDIHTNTDSLHYDAAKIRAYFTAPPGDQHSNPRTRVAGRPGEAPRPQVERSVPWVHDWNNPDAVPPEYDAHNRFLNAKGRQNWVRGHKKYLREKLAQDGNERAVTESAIVTSKRVMIQNINMVPYVPDDGGSSSSAIADALMEYVDDINADTNSTDPAYKKLATIMRLAGRVGVNVIEAVLQLYASTPCLPRNMANFVQWHDMLLANMNNLLLQSGDKVSRATVAWLEANVVIQRSRETPDGPELYMDNFSPSQDWNEGWEVFQAKAVSPPRVTRITVPMGPPVNLNVNTPRENAFPTSGGWENARAGEINVLGRVSAGCTARIGELIGVAEDFDIHVESFEYHSTGAAYHVNGRPIAQTIHGSHGHTIQPIGDFDNNVQCQPYREWFQLTGRDICSSVFVTGRQRPALWLLVLSFMFAALSVFTGLIFGLIPVAILIIVAILTCFKCYNRCPPTIHRHFYYCATVQRELRDTRSNVVAYIVDIRITSSLQHRVNNPPPTPSDVEVDFNQHWGTEETRLFEHAFALLARRKEMTPDVILQITATIARIADGSGLPLASASRVESIVRSAARTVTTMRMQGNLLVPGRSPGY